jgi:hypothetical protein
MESKPLENHPYEQHFIHVEIWKRRPKRLFGDYAAHDCLHSVSTVPHEHVVQATWS